MGFLSRMAYYIDKDESGKYKICNPVMEEENFADKWAIEPEKAKTFFDWLERAKRKLLQSLCFLKAWLSKVS